MTKLNRTQRETERQVRDRMNGIVRNEQGKIIKMNGCYTLLGVDEALINAGIWI